MSSLVENMSNCVISTRERDASPSNQNVFQLVVTSKCDILVFILLSNIIILALKKLVISYVIKFLFISNINVKLINLLF